MEKRNKEMDFPPPPIPTPVSAEQLQTLVSLSPDALLVVDETGCIVMVNQQLAALFGYTQQELQATSLERLVPTSQREQHHQHRQHYFHTPRQRTMGTGLPLFGLYSDGSLFPIDISLRPVSLDGPLLVIGAVRDLSEQRRLERERFLQAEQLHMYTQLLNLSHDAILVRDSVGRVVLWNTGAECLYGWSTQQALGHITHNLLHTRFPVDRQTVDAHLERESFWEGELLHTCQDGRVVMVESRQALLRNDKGQPIAIMEINRDITQRQELEQQEQAIHQATTAQLSFLQHVLDALPSSVYLVYGHEARLLLANRAAMSLWGAIWTPEQPMMEFLASKGITLLAAQGSQLLPEQYATLRAVRETETVMQQQEIIQRPDGSQLPVLVSALPLSARPLSGPLAETTATAGGIALVVHQDVSVLKESEYLKDEFIAVAAHELRNPLAALTGYVDMLSYQSQRGKGAKLFAWQRDALAEIAQATTRLDKLTADLLDVTRVQARRLTLTCTSTDLVLLSQRLLQQFQLTTKRHTLSLDTQRTTLMIQIDRGRIEQVLSNLLSNAIKYSPQGGPVELGIYEEAEQASVLLTVRDHGMGIPAKQQERIFGRFVRADNARSSEITGTGLGLYLSRELAEQHGGRLWFESAEGVGSTFFLSLPLC